MSGSMHCILHSLLFFHMLCTFVWNYYFYPYISLVILRKSSAGIYENVRKSMSGGCFSVLVNSNLSLRICLFLSYMLELDFIFFLRACFCCFSAFFSLKKKIGGKRCSKFFFSFLLLTFQISHVFLPDISVHYALLKYTYIYLRF
jgi:hypothetical protein